MRWNYGKYLQFLQALLKSVNGTCNHYQRESHKKFYEKVWHPWLRHVSSICWLHVDHYWFVDLSLHPLGWQWAWNLPALTFYPVVAISWWTGHTCRDCSCQVKYIHTTLKHNSSNFFKILAKHSLCSICCINVFDFRLLTLHMGKRNQSVDKFLIKLLTRALLFIYLACLIVHALVKSFSKDEYVHSKLSCLVYLRYHYTDSFIAVKMLVFVITTIIALVCGFKINRLILQTIGTNSLVQSNNISLKDVMRIPTRATIFSILSGLPLIAMTFVIFVSGTDAVTSLYVTTTLGLLIAALRAPCSILSVHSNKQRQERAEHHQDDVEARRRKEIEWAWKTRVGRVKEQDNTQQNSRSAKIFIISD